MRSLLHPSTLVLLMVLLLLFSPQGHAWLVTWALGPHCYGAIGKSAANRVRAHATSDEFGGLSERSLDFLLRTYRNVKSMAIMTEKSLIMSPTSEEIMDRAEALAVETSELERALLRKLSTENPTPEMGQGSLARRELGLPPSRVMVTGGGGVLAGLVFGKIQRATGTGATNNVGLKHPNVLAYNTQDAMDMNRILMGRFAGAGCWNEKTEVQTTSAWDNGLDGVMGDFKLAVAGDERPFILVPRDGCDMVVLGTRLNVKGSYKWGLSMGLDFSVDTPMPSPEELGEIYDKSRPPALTHAEVFAAHVAAARDGLNLDTQQRKREAARSSTRGPARHIFALVHPSDCADASALAAVLRSLEASAGSVPFTAIALFPGNGNGGGGAVRLQNTKDWRTRSTQSAGAPGPPDAEFLEDLRVLTVPLASSSAASSSSSSSLSSAVDAVALAAVAPKIAASGGEGNGNDTAMYLSHESYAELVTQLILLADADTSRVVFVGPDKAVGYDGGARIKAGVLESSAVLEALQSSIVL